VAVNFNGTSGDRETPFRRNPAEEAWAKVLFAMSGWPMLGSFNALRNQII